MDANRWNRAKELFGSALEREPRERSAFLAEACGGDESLRQEVESLLAAHQDVASTAVTAMEESLSAADIDEDRILGRRIGTYQVMKRIGEGGMAAVYLAFRADDQYRKQVAIKLVPLAMATRELVQRFRNERQTLAALEHPNIVRLFDGGTTEDGRPYLVMEYVEGTPITEYADTHRLSVPERLQLFRTVCSAVSYAHQKLIIHRDLKPSNILVTADGTPKLLDFGIAKLLNPEMLAEKLAVTQAGQRLMTPEYASPEQVRGEPLTNASDIYSLGAILYELLTGHRLYRFKSYTITEIEHVICEEEPNKPSTVVTQAEEVFSPGGVKHKTITPEEVGRRREDKPERLRRKLQGDLDTIVMMALRKEPQRRYTSVFEFAEDIRRYLEGEPIRARPGTAIYRGVKLLRRHRETTAALLVAAVVFGGILAWEMGRHVSQTVGIVSSPVDASRVKIRRSVAVLGFRNLTGKSDTAWLSTALSEMMATELAAGEKLRLASGENVARMKIDLKLADADSYAPDTLEKIRRMLSVDEIVLGSYLDLGNQVRLDVKLQDVASGETVDTLVENGAENDLSALVSRTGDELRQKLGIGTVTAREAVAVKASLPSNREAARRYSEGLAKLRVFESLAAKDLLELAVTADPNFALAHSAISAAWLQLGYEKIARDEAKKAFELSPSLSKEDRLFIEGQYREANHEWNRAIEISQNLFSLFPDNLEYGLRLAESQNSAERYKEALATVAQLRQLPPPTGNDPRIDLEESDVASSLGDARRELVTAESAVEKGQALGAKLLTARALLHQLWALRNLGEPHKALTVAEKARQIFADTGDRAQLAAMLQLLGSVRDDLGDLAGAQSNWDQSAATYREIGNKADLATTLFAQGYGRVQRGDLSGAMRLQEEVLAISREIDSRYLRAGALGEVGKIRFRQGDLATARKNLDEAINLFRQLGDQRMLGHYASDLGTLLVSTGDVAGARTAADEALAIRTARGDRESVAISQVQLAELAIEEGHVANAEALAERALEEFRTENVTDRRIAAETVLARALLAEGNPAKAQTSIASIAPLVAKSQDVETRIRFAIVEARVRAASGRFIEAEKSLEGMLAEATKYGFLDYQFQVRLALSEIEMESGTIAAGRAHLAALEKDATAKGFLLIARKAAAAAKGST